MPGASWYNGFIKRHRENLTVRKCQTVKRARAAVGHKQTNSYFVLKKLPTLTPPPSETVAPVVSDTLLNYLQSCRKGRDKPIKTRQKKNDCSTREVGIIS
jgi:hypothetical protein